MEESNNGKKHPGWGGARKGAGRKRTYRQQFSFQVSGEIKEYILQQTNKSAFIIECIRQYIERERKGLYNAGQGGTNSMSYNEMAQLDVLNVVRGIKSEADYIEFRNMLAQYFANKAQMAIDAMWENGEISEDTIEE